MTRAEANRDIRNFVNAVMIPRIGAELRIPNTGIMFRTGYFEKPGYYKFSSRKNTRKYVTFGGGMFFNNKIELDGAYVHGWWKQTTVDGLINEEIFEAKTDSRFYGGLTIHF